MEFSDNKERKPYELSIFWWYEISDSSSNPFGVQISEVT
jgi:hypothetical protein